MVVALVLTEAILLIRARRRGQAGARLQIRMVAMFAIVAAVPAFIVAVVATIALEPGPRPVVLASAPVPWWRARARLPRPTCSNTPRCCATTSSGWPSELEAAHDTFETDQEHFQTDPDRAGGDPLAAVHLADPRRRRQPDHAGADQRAGSAPAMPEVDHARRRGGGADPDRARLDQSRRLGRQAARLRRHLSVRGAPGRSRSARIHAARPTRTSPSTGNTRPTGWCSRSPSPSCMSASPSCCCWRRCGSASRWPTASSTRSAT